jgi:hypothetical protein
MKNKIIIAVLLGILVLPELFSQWPGYFYAFELKDADGNIIDTNNTNYKMTTVRATENLITSVSICEGNKIWHFYAGGNRDLDKTNSLKIEKLKNGEVVETMTIEFPSSLSGGKEKFYRDLYVGTINFKKGKHKIKVPETDNQWDNLNKMEEKICRLDYAVSVYYDISKFQK